jgi:hypothetical protein
LELVHVSKSEDCMARWLGHAYRLIQYPRHAINKELKVLWPVQAAKEVAEEVLRCEAAAVARFGYRVQDEYK